MPYFFNLIPILFLEHPIRRFRFHATWKHYLELLVYCFLTSHKHCILDFANLTFPQTENAFTDDYIVPSWLLFFSSCSKTQTKKPGNSFIFFKCVHVHFNYCMLQIIYKRKKERKKEKRKRKKSKEWKKKEKNEEKIKVWKRNKTPYLLTSSYTLVITVERLTGLCFSCILYELVRLDRRLRRRCRRLQEIDIIINHFQDWRWEGMWEQRRGMRRRRE